MTIKTITKYALPSLLCCLLCNTLTAQNNADSVRVYLDKSLDIIEKNALNRDKINWADFRKELHDKSAQAKNYEDIVALYPYIFEAIDDHHGALLYNNKTYKWDGTESITPNKAVEKAVSRYTNVTSVLISKNIAYIRVPGNNDFNASKMDSITLDIKKAIGQVSSKSVKGWIIDLRNNTGGNMYPMIAGLSDLIGQDEKVGGFITSDGKPDGVWSIRNGTFFVDSTKVAIADYECFPIPKNIPLVVLVSSYTASSGEMTAIATKGRKNSILLGGNTAGYTTANQGFKLNSNSGLNLAIAYPLDRNGVRYSYKLVPDTLILGGDNFEDLKKDSKIKAAAHWLKNHF